jgi:hypothetical protein
MLIFNIRRAPPGAGANILASFDAEISPELRLYGLSLRQYPDGSHRISVPNAHGRRVATFAPVLAERLTQAATIALSELKADNDKHAA